MFSRNPSLAEAERYEQQISKLLEQIKATNRSFDALLDSSSCTVLAQDVLAPLERVAGRAVAAGAHRVALVSASALKAMQTKRLARDVQLFSAFGSADAAIAWLNSERELDSPEGATQSAHLSPRGAGVFAPR